MLWRISSGKFPPNKHFVHSLELLGIYLTEENLRIHKAHFVLLREFIL